MVGEIQEIFIILYSDAQPSEKYVTFLMCW